MDVIREFQACDLGGCFVIYANILKMEVIYVIFFRGYYVIFLKSGVNSLYLSVKRKIYAGDPPRVL